MTDIDLTDGKEQTTEPVEEERKQELLLCLRCGKTFTGIRGEPCDDCKEQED